MAQAKSLKFAEQVVMLGDGATPTEVFSAPCGTTELTLDVNIEVNTTNVPDCTDPDLPAWLVSDEVSKQMVITLSGTLDRDAKIMWEKWLMDGGEKNVRWVTTGNLAAGGGHYQAPGILSQFQYQGQRGQRWQFNIGITLNGKPTHTPAAA